MHHTVFDTPVANTLLRAFSKGFLKLTGWKLEGQDPAIHPPFRGIMMADTSAIKALYAPFKGKNADQFEAE